MITANAKDEREFDIRELLQAVISKSWIVLVEGIGSAILIFLISYYVVEWKYEATTQIYVLSKEDSAAQVTYADLQVSSYLIKDYMVLVTNRLVTEQVIGELNLDMKQEELVKLIHVENPDETRVLKIKVEYKDPIVAARIANAVREATTGLITKLTGHEQASQIIEANIPKNPSTPNIINNTLLGGTLGAMISIFFILLNHLSEDTAKTSEKKLPDSNAPGTTATQRGKT